MLDNVQRNIVATHKYFHWQLCQYIYSYYTLTKGDSVDILLLGKLSRCDVVDNEHKSSFVVHNVLDMFFVLSRCSKNRPHNPYTQSSRMTLVWGLGVRIRYKCGLFGSQYRNAPELQIILYSFDGSSLMQSLSSDPVKSTTNIILLRGFFIRIINTTFIELSIAA